ncbi:MAG: DUF4625 domain-containing protein [Cyclobacteriaceae bacterium]
MKKLPLLGLVGLAVMAFSCDTGDDPLQDLEAPVIEHADGHDAIRPENGEIIGASADHMPLRFAVEDPSGIEQIRVNIHANFDGHSHARRLNDFQRLDVNDIMSSESANPDLKFPEGATRVNVDGPGTDIYWDGNNSRVDGHVIAGPYDILIEATDVYGNQTDLADGGSYISTFQIRTPYAPLIEITNLHDDELEGEAGEPLMVEGMVAKGDHELSSDLAFLWVRLTEEHEEEHDDEDGHNHRVLDEGDDFFDMMWGNSAWMDEGNGPALPDASSLNLAEIFTGDNAIILPSGEDHLELIIRAEDINGNITEMHFVVHLE